MFKNIVKAELYKQYEKKSSWILLVVIFVLSLFAFNGVYSTIVDTYYFSNGDADSIIFTMFTSIMLIVIIRLYVLFIVPITAPSSIIGDDFQNSVIANTIASGVSRKTIILAKFSTLLIHITSMILAFIIPMLIIHFSYTLSHSAIFVEVFDDADMEVLVTMLGVQSALVTVLSAISLLAVSSCMVVLIKSRKLASLATVGIYMAKMYFTAKYMSSSAVYGMDYSDILERSNNFQMLVSIIMIAIALPITYSIFVKRDY